MWSTPKANCRQCDRKELGFIRFHWSLYILLHFRIATPLSPTLLPIDGDFILDLNGTNRHDGDMSEFVG
ncbi:unnamed protein product [Rhodiola kirilowii]